MTAGAVVGVVVVSAVAFGFVAASVLKFRLESVVGAGSVVF